MDSRSRLTTSALTFSVVLAALGAACGPPPPVDAPPSPSSAPSVAPAPTVTPSADPSAAATVAPTAAPVALPPGMPAKNSALSATKFQAELKKLGFDGKKAMLDLEKMDLPTKKKLMPLFQKALGYDSCNGCHAGDGDYRTSTRNMKVTRKMWSQFVSAMRDDAGGLVFCDSCHNGAERILNRTDKKAVGKFMHEDYVAKLTRADKQSNGCATCHGTPMEPEIIAKQWGIAAK
jgi:hypothetical protein